MRARENPYRSECVTRLRLRVPGSDCDTLLQQWETLGRSAALVAPHGHGKSTMLRALCIRLQESGWRTHTVQLSQDQPQLRSDWRRWLASLGPRDVLLLDGAEQLSTWTWWRFRRAARHLGGLLITTHRPGRLPTLHRCETSPALLHELACELAGPAGPSLAEAEQLFVRHAGNVREALMSLYANAARAQAAAPVGDERRCGEWARGSS